MTNKIPNGNDWKEYRRLVLTELSGLKERNEKICERLLCIETTLAELKPRIGIWAAIATGMGAVGGFITVGIFALLKQ